MPAMVARKPANQPVFDHPACAIGALEAVATCSAQSERRKAPPVKEQQALLAAFDALFGGGSKSDGAGQAASAFDDLFRRK